MLVHASRKYQRESWYWPLDHVARNKASVSDMVQEPLFAGNHSITDPFRPLKSHLHGSTMHSRMGLSW